MSAAAWHWAADRRRPVRRHRRRTAATAAAPARAGPGAMRRRARRWCRPAVPARRWRAAMAPAARGRRVQCGRRQWWAWSLHRHPNLPPPKSKVWQLGDLACAPTSAPDLCLSILWRPIAPQRPLYPALRQPAAAPARSRPAPWRPPQRCHAARAWVHPACSPGAAPKGCAAARGRLAARPQPSLEVAGLRWRLLSRLPRLLRLLRLPRPLQAAAQPRRGPSQRRSSGRQCRPGACAPTASARAVRHRPAPR